jgi:uncharacterized protein (TIGR02246 family)
MPKTLLVSLSSLLLVALTACTSAPPPPAVDVAAEQTKLRDLESGWVKDAAAKDLEKSVAHYADDAVLMMPGAPAAKGKDAIRAAWKGLLADPNLKLTFSADRVEISQAGDLATTQGSYTMTVTNPKTKKPVEDKGSYVTVFKKQSDGSWKVIEDITASQLAP